MRGWGSAFHPMLTKTKWERMWAQVGGLASLYIPCDVLASSLKDEETLVGGAILYQRLINLHTICFAVSPLTFNKHMCTHTT